MTLDELDENEDEFGEEDEAAIELYRLVNIAEFDMVQFAAICPVDCIFLSFFLFCFST